jgi:hypothetical protein
MKKTALLMCGALLALLVSGCNSVEVVQGSPNVYAPFALVNNLSGNALIQPVSRKDYTIVKTNVVGKVELKSYFSIINQGDASYATLKAAALQNAAGADDLIDIVIDYNVNSVFGINTTTVTLTGTAIKYN